MRKPVEPGGKARAFDNDVLERLSRIHPAVPLFFWGPLAVWMIGSGLRQSPSALVATGLTVFGLAAWTLTEYILHRWVFHFQPSNPTAARWYYPVHQLHHDVQEWDRLVAPLLLSLPLGALFFVVFSMLLGWPTVLPAFGGFVVGYLAYDYIHFYTHFARPKTALGRGLRRRHLQHHHAFHDRWYGVSSPLWDYVFRTHVPRKRLARP